MGIVHNTQWILCVCLDGTVAVSNVSIFYTVSIEREKGAEVYIFRI